MKHSNLNHEGAIIVAAGMKYMPFLEYFYLYDNSFSPEGATALDKPYLTELQVLNISHNNMESSWAYAIACGMAHCTKQKCLIMIDTN